MQILKSDSSRENAGDTQDFLQPFYKNVRRQCRILDFCTFDFDEIRIYNLGRAKYVINSPKVGRTQNFFADPC